MGRKKKRTSSPAWKSVSLHVTGQIVFVLESFGGKATSEHLVLILHMALQNFVPLTILPATKLRPKMPPLENLLKIMLRP